MSTSPRPNSFFARYTFVIYLIYCFYVGALITAMPWIPWIWEKNYFLYRFPAIKPFLLSPFFRGAVSGLGILNILLGVIAIWNRKRR
jgi:hypothetical protein